MNPAVSKDQTPLSRPSVSTLLQEALDTPLQALHIEDDNRRPNASAYPVTLASPPQAHIDQSQHPHHHTHNKSFEAPIRYTSESEQTQTDTMPIVRSGRLGPGLTRMMSKSGSVSGISGVSAGRSAVLTESSYHASSVKEPSSSLDITRQSDQRVSSTTHHPSQANTMRQEANQSRHALGHATNHLQEGSNIAISSTTLNRVPLNSVRTSVQPPEALVASTFL
jgi:hypothetical protein